MSSLRAVEITAADAATVPDGTDAAQASGDGRSRQTPLVHRVYQRLLAQIAGGMFGTGLGRGRPDITPLAESDYIVAALGEELGLVEELGVEDDLQDPRTVPQVDEDELAEIAAAVDPALDLDRPSGVLPAERAGGDAGHECAHGVSPFSVRGRSPIGTSLCDLSTRSLTTTTPDCRSFSPTRTAVRQPRFAAFFSA